MTSLKYFDFPQDTPSSADVILLAKGDESISFRSTIDELRVVIKDDSFGVDAGDIIAIGATLSASQTLETDADGKAITAEKKTAYNKDFGSISGTVPEIDTALSVSSIVETDAGSKIITATKNTAYNKNFGTGSTDVPEIDSTLGNSLIVETTAAGKLTTVAKGTAYNKDFGTGTTNIPEIGATLGNSLLLQTTSAGKVTTANSPTTKGDLVAHDGTSPTRLAVGTDNYVLTADSSASEGVSWKAYTGFELFESAEQTITAGGAYSIAHGLSSVPVLFQVFAKRLNSTSDGWNAGDIIPTTSDSSQTGAYNITLRADATNIEATMGADGMRILSKTTGAALTVSGADWKFIIRAWA